jgi:1,4-alpha-glucan branching enzyme
VLDYPEHQGVRRWVGDLNRLYRTEPALHEREFTADGFEWIDCDDWETSVLSFVRKDRSGGSLILVLCNFTPIPRENYAVGVPRAGYWHELLNSDATIYGGSGTGNFGGVEAAPVGAHGRFHSLTVTLPPLSIVFFKSG